MIKKTKLFLYICLAMFLLNSCTEEKEYLENNNRDLKFSRKPFKELLSLKDFNSAYQKVKSEKQRSIASRSAIEDEYNFTIVEGKDVKIVEVDNKTFYNILIERDAKSAAYFENLLIMVEKIDNVDQVSAYIMKYATSNGLISFTEESDNKMETLFSRYTSDCNKVCTPICTIHGWNPIEGVYVDHPHTPYGSGCSVSYFECTDICVTDIGGGGNTDIFNNGGSESGGGGTPPSNPSPSPSGASGAAPPPELLIDPVFEEEEKTPCLELNKLFKPVKNLPSGGMTIEAAIAMINNPSSFADDNENGFNIFINADGDYYARQIPFERRRPNAVYYSFLPNALGGGHSHRNVLYPMYSGEDTVEILNKFYTTFSYYAGGQQDANVPVQILASNNGVYALKIENSEALTNAHNLFSDKEEYKKFCDNAEDIAKGISSSIINNTPSNHEKGFLKLITNFDGKGVNTGIGMYKLFEEPITINGTTRVVKRWKKIVLSNNGNSVDYFPCEN